MLIGNGKWRILQTQLKLKLKYAVRSRSSDIDLPIEERVIVYGTGFVGTSIAYHISQIWPKSCIVIDSFPKGGDYGSKSKVHNSAIINHFKSNPLEANLIAYTSKLFKVDRIGSLHLATDYERLSSFKRTISTLKCLPGITEPKLLSVDEISEKYPWINCKNIKAGVWMADDGVINDLSLMKKKLRKQAEKNGVVFYYGWQLRRILTMAKRVIGIEMVHLGTGQRVTVGCEYFVNAGGFIARSLGTISRPEVRIPILNVEHQILETSAIPMDNILNEKFNFILHDCDNRYHIHQQVDGYNRSLLLSGVPIVSKPISEEYKVSHSSEYRLGLDPSFLQPDWNSFAAILNSSVNRISELKKLNLKHLYNVPKSYSADGRIVVGESPEIENYFVAAGVDYELSGGVGKVIADQITKANEAPFYGDTWSIDIRRFTSAHSDINFLMDRLREVPARSIYNMGFQTHLTDFDTGHPLRTSPLYQRFVDAGARFMQLMDYERPAVYSISSEMGHRFFDQHVGKHKILKNNTFGKPIWFEDVHDEYEACRTRVGLCDYTSLTKLELSSPSTVSNGSVINFLQYLCSNDVNVEVGNIVHTGMQNERGGYENDISLVRLDNNRFMLIGPTEQQRRCLSWIERHLHGEFSQITVQDITNAYTALCLMGPYAIDLLSELVGNAEETSLEKFPFFTYKSLPIHGTFVRVCNLTHTGELGYVLYIPNEFANAIYDIIISTGAKYQLKHVGSVAVRSLRIEKFYAFWGQDLDTSTTPLECGRSFRVKFQKNFIGRDALIKQRDEGIKRRYVQLVLEDFDDENFIWPNGNEPIYLVNNEHNDKPVGMTTTAGYGYSLRKHICLGFIFHPLKDKIINSEYLLKSKYEVEINNERYPVKLNLHSPKLAAFMPHYTVV